MSRHCSRLRSAAVACFGAALLIAACDHSPTPQVAQPLPPPTIVKKADEGVIQRTLPVPSSEAQPTAEAKLAGQDGIPPPAADGARVALLLPLSGRLADMGKGMLNASQMALFEVADDRLQLIAYDTADTPEGAQAKARKAISDGASLLIGPLLATSTKAVAPLARAANIRVLSFSSDRRAGGEGIYVLGFAPETEVERVVSYTAETGARRFSLLAPKDNYGNTVAAALRKTAKDLTLTIDRIELYDPRTQDFGDILDRVRGAPPPPPPASATLPSAAPAAAGVTPVASPSATAAPVAPPFDALLIADTGDRLKLLAGQLAAKNIGPDRVRILGTGAWDEPAIRQDRALVGAWFAAPEPPFRQEFERSYEKAFGMPPPRLATLAYDATALAAVLVRERGRDGYADEWLTNPEGFFGRDGLFRLVPEGYADRRLAVLQIGSDGAAVVSNAQRQFTGF